MQYLLWGAQEGLPFRDQGFRAGPGSLQGSQGQKQPETTLLWDQCSDVTPPTPKPTGLSHLINFSKPAPPQWWPQFRKGFPRHRSPHAPPSPTGEALSDPLPGAKPSLGGELGRGEARGKEKGASPLLWPSAHWPPEQLTHHRATDDLMPFFVVAQSLTHVRLLGPHPLRHTTLRLSFLPLPLDHMQRHASRPSLIYPSGLQCPALSFLLGELFILQHPALMYPSQ